MMPAIVFTGFRYPGHLVSKIEKAQGIVDVVLRRSVPRVDDHVENAWNVEVGNSRIPPPVNHCFGITNVGGIVAGRSQHC